MSKEKPTKIDLLLKDKDFNPFIQGDDRDIVDHLEKNEEAIDTLIQKAKDGLISIKITKSKDKDHWKAEARLKNSGKIIYFTDIPIEVTVLEQRMVSADIIPEYIEE